MSETIMVVDDDRAIRDIVVEILADEGHQVRGYADGLEALASLERETPRLVMLDMRMPLLTGWEFAAAMRARGHDIPIIVMTAAQDARAWAEQIEAVGYIAKPFEIDSLLKVVDRALAGPDAGATRLSLQLPAWGWGGWSPRPALAPA